MRQGLAYHLRGFPHRGGILVWPKLKIIYMKPSRCAGTSIRFALERHLPDYIHHKKYPKEISKWLFSIDDEELRKYLIFSAVRNPWDRVVSAAFTYNMPVDRFILDYIRSRHWPDKETEHHARPIYPYMYCNGESVVDYWIAFESLQEDFEFLCDILNIPKTELPKLLPSEHEHYSRYYTDELKGIVERVYADDIRAFDYKFETE